MLSKSNFCRYSKVGLTFTSFEDEHWHGACTGDEAFRAVHGAPREIKGTCVQVKVRPVQVDFSLTTPRAESDWFLNALDSTHHFHTYRFFKCEHAHLYITNMGNIVELLAVFSDFSSCDSSAGELVSRWNPGGTRTRSKAVDIPG